MKRRQMLSMKWLLVFILMGINSIGLAAPNSLIGSWKTIDDKDKQPRSIVRIYQDGDKFYGQITRIYPRPDDKGICDKCTGAYKNQKIKGMVIVKDMKAAESGWDDGRILDPKTGHWYNCKMNLADDGKTLQVRGYLGFSLLGRTQNWYRVN